MDAHKRKTTDDNRDYFLCAKRKLLKLKSTHILSGDNPELEKLIRIFSERADGVIVPRGTFECPTVGQ